MGLFSHGGQEMTWTAEVDGESAQTYKGFVTACNEMGMRDLTLIKMGADRYSIRREGQVVGVLVSANWKGSW